MARRSGRSSTVSARTAPLLVVAVAVSAGMRMPSAATAAEPLLLLHQGAHRPDDGGGMPGQGRSTFRFARRSAQELQAVLVLPRQKGGANDLGGLSDARSAVFRHARRSEEELRRENLLGLCRWKGGEDDRRGGEREGLALLPDGRRSASELYSARLLVLHRR